MAHRNKGYKDTRDWKICLFYIYSKLGSMYAEKYVLLDAYWYFSVDKVLDIQSLKIDKGCSI